MSFRDLSIKRSYVTYGPDNITKSFLIPALKQARLYRRSVGYFSSSVFSTIIDGIVGLTRNDGKIQIIASPNLTQEDIDAINLGYKKREEIINGSFERDFIKEIETLGDEELQLLAALIANGTLDIKIAVTKGCGIYHDKLGMNNDWNGSSSITYTTKTYAVTYNANGGTGAPSTQYKTHGTALTLSSTKPTKAAVSAGTYTVTLNANGGTCSSSSLSAKRTTSYTFSKWNTNSSGTGTSYNAGASYTTNAALSLYAIYSSSTSTAAVTLPTPTRSGYNFMGWATSSTATTGTTGSYTPSGNVTLYAIWGAKGLVYIGNEAYQIYIGNGSSWDLYAPYVGNGSSWDLCS